MVEHSLGKGEVVGSIPTGSTSLPAIFAADLAAGLVPELTERDANPQVPAGIRLAPLLFSRMLLGLPCLATVL